MNNEKMAQIISQLRKEKNMTQKELAAKLGVTDKAVSKWERGLSCPDISLLSELSQVLGISTSELLDGERNHEEVKKVEPIVEKTLKYADSASKNRFRKLKLIIGYTFTTLCLIGILVCVIVDLAMTRSLTWSWYTISSTVFAWCIIMPVLAWGKKGVFISMIAITVLTIPYLYALEVIIGIKELIMPVGVSVTIASLVFLWIVYFMFFKSRLSYYMSTVLLLLLTVPLSLFINITAAIHEGQPYFNPWDAFSCGITIFVAAIVAIVGYMRTHKFLK